MDVNNAQSYGSLTALVGGQDPQVRHSHRVLQAVKRNKDKLKLPPFVLGFRTDQERAGAKRSSSVSKACSRTCQAAPDNPVAKMTGTKTIAGSQFLTLEGDGSMIPWDQIPFFAEKDADKDEVLKVLRGLKLKVALGVHKDYLLLVVGDSFDAIEKLGRAPSWLPAQEFEAGSWPVRANA